jgi:hypothetical protein
VDVFYFNKWQGIDLPEVRECFRALNEDELSRLETGTLIWVDLDPYHPAGHVYGFTAATVTALRTHDRGVTIEYDAAGVGGQVQVPATKIFTVSDGSRLLRLVKRHGERILSAEGRGGDAGAFKRWWNSRR